MRTQTTLAVAISITVSLAATTAEAGRKDDQKEAKISAYVKVINIAASQVFDNRKKLVEFEEKKKPAAGCKDTHLSWPLASSGYTPSLYRDLAKTAKSKPKTKLDKAASQMAVALEALSTIQSEARDYYGKRKYKEDDCKESAGLHAKTLAAMASYIEADREIRSFVEARNAARAVVDLKKTKKKYGARFRYYQQKIMMDAKAVLDSVESQPKDKPFDVKLVAAAADELFADIKALTPMAEKERSTLDTFAYFRFYRKTLELEKAVQGYLERNGPDGEPYTDYEKKQLDGGSKSVKGSFALVISRYNEVVDHSNRIRYPAKIK